MSSIRQNQTVETNYRGIVKKLKIELEEYKKSIYDEHKEHEGKTKFVHKVLDSDEYVADYMEVYLYRVNKEKIKCMEKYLNFLEKIIDTKKYDQFEKWLTWVIKYRNFVYHNWKNY